MWWISRKGNGKVWGVEGRIGSEGFAHKCKKDIYKDIYEYLYRERDH